MEFITLEDCTSDSILTATEHDIDYANNYLSMLASGFGLKEDEILLPARDMVKHLGTVLAYRENALSMVGSDPTVTTEGGRNEDVYLQKYRLYDALVAKLESKLDYSSFAMDGTDGAGKGGVGIIRLSRA